jgi:hypothetical protein
MYGNLTMFIIKWELEGKVWESEKLAHSPMEAVAFFRKAVKARRIAARLIGISDCDGKMQVQLV